MSKINHKNFKNKNLKNVAREIPYMVTEIAEKIYAGGEIDVFKREDVEPIISNMRFETEMIISETLTVLFEAICEKYDD